MARFAIQMDESPQPKIRWPRTASRVRHPGDCGGGMSRHR
jgi:hypothetical protein